MTFSETILSQPLVLVDFYATWCEPCKWAEPILDVVIEKFSGKLNLHKIDIDEQPDVARDHHVLSVPTLILFKDGSEVWRMRGFDTAPALTKIFSEWITA